MVVSLNAEFEYLRSAEGQYRADGRTNDSAIIDATTAIVGNSAKEEFDNESFVEDSGEPVMTLVRATTAVAIAAANNCSSSNS